VDQSASRTATRSPVRAPPLVLRLLDGFQLTHRDGTDVALPATGERVLAFLALAEQPVRRCMVAGSLWPDSSETRSSGSLRSALWRISSSAGSAVEVSGTRLSLSSSITVDVHGLVEAARQVRVGRLRADPTSLVRRFEAELLPDWYDDWVVLTRERWRQIRLHALESLAEVLCRAGDCSTAAEAGLAAVRADPLRETAHRALIQTYLCEGNRSEALRQYRSYETIMRDELGLEPSATLATLVGMVAGERT
jgi:DNA-binding SARP family transcriptional activator